MVPLRLLDRPWAASGRIVVLEPRRLAARAAARRMAHLLGEPVGATVGYRTRDDARVGPDTRVEVVTEGILTRRIQTDIGLGGIALVVFDEFHERSVHADLGLALCLDVRGSLRPDLRLLVMSATLDGDRVARLIGGDDDPAPVVTSEGRTHPVEVRWRPRQRRERLEPAMADAVGDALREPGDVLAFLPGAGEIRRCADAVRGVAPGVDVAPLYGALPAADQDAAIAPSPPGRRKVVLSTDIAETSLTVEGIGTVVDAGLDRSPRFDPRTGMTRLTTESASRASADQRAGRAGRLGSGVAIRLWSKLEHAARPAFADPEVTRTDLAALALELAAWGTTDPAGLRFLDPPPDRTWDEALELLRLLGALDAGRASTPVGRAMLALPVHPRLARMVVGGVDQGLGWTAALVAVALEERDVLRGRPDDLPADLTVRVALLGDSGRRDDRADDRARRRVRERAADLARRAGIDEGPVLLDAVGPLLALAYPDRIARARERQPGRFVLRNGSGAVVDRRDPLAAEPMLVAADVDGRRKDARIRLAAPVDPDTVALLWDHEVTETSRLVWDPDRDDLVREVTRHLGRFSLGRRTHPPIPGAEATAALVERVRRAGLAALDPSPTAVALMDRLDFLRRTFGHPWPDVGQRALLARSDEWLVPALAGATGRADLAAVDLAGAILAVVPPERYADLDRLAPPTLAVPGGRRVPVDYSDDPPTLAVRVQAMFGTTETPTVASGRVPVRLTLLSPAGRPLQITSDLAGFWAGSWADVRKDMAGRYPKHDWPADPANATPPGRT